MRVACWWPRGRLARLAGHCASPGTAFGWARRRGADRPQTEDGLAEVMEALAASLEAGESLPQAVARAQGQAPGPWRPLLGSVLSRHALGMPLHAALDAVRPPNHRSFAVMARVLAIHGRVGGPLAVTLKGLADLMRTESAIRSEAMGRTAEARWTARLLVATPLFLLLYFYMVAPWLLRPLVSAQGLAALGYGVLSFGCGIWTARALIRFIEGAQP